MNESKPDYVPYNRGNLRKALAWFKVRIPKVVGSAMERSKGAKGRGFSKATALALLDACVDHAHRETATVLNPVGRGRAGPPALGDLAVWGGTTRWTAALVMDWFVEIGLLAKAPHGYMQATTWTFNWPVRLDETRVIESGAPLPSISGKRKGLKVAPRHAESGAPPPPDLISETIRGTTDQAGLSALTPAREAAEADGLVVPAEVLREPEPEDVAATLENDTTSPASRLVEEPLRGNTVPDETTQVDAGEVVPSLHERYAIDPATGQIRLKKDGTPMLKRGPKLGDRKSESWKRALAQSAAGRRPPEEQIAKAVAALRDWTINNPDLVAAAAAHARAVKAERRTT
jgi:hypothetical protein